MPKIISVVKIPTFTDRELSEKTGTSKKLKELLTIQNLDIRGVTTCFAKKAC